MPRDDFSNNTISILAERAAYLCSNPACRRLTIGPHSQEEKSLSSGIAAHICAAAPGGPRYDPNQSSAERKGIRNALWVCHSCSDIIDKDEAAYPIALLLSWKKTHEEYVRQIGLQAPAPFSVTGSPADVLSNLQTLLTGSQTMTDGIGQLSRLLSIDTQEPNRQGDDENWNRRVDMARNLLRDGQYRAARPLLISLREEASQSKPSPAVRSRIANNLGACALGVNEVDEAQRCFQEAVTYEPESPKALSNLAMVALIQNDAEQALCYSTQAWDADPTDPNILGVHIQALHRTNRTAEAERLLYDNAWSMERDECAAAIASVWRDLSKYEEAEAFARRGLNATPNDAQLYMLLASVIVQPIQNDLLDARRQYGALPPAFVTRLEEAEQMYGQAISLFEQQGNGQARRDALVSRSGIRFLLGRGEEGLHDCEQVLREKPDNPHALENKGRILLVAQRPAEAISCFESLLSQTGVAAPACAADPAALPPERFPIVALLADAYVDTDQPAKVSSLLRPYWKPGTREPRQRYVAELLLFAYAGADDVDAAAEVLHYLEQDFPDDPSAQAIMAEYFARMDNLPCAITLYKKALDQADSSWKRQFSLRLGQLYLRVQEYASAAAAFAPFVNVQSELRELHAYTVCLYKGGSRTKALRIAQEYRAAAGVTPVIAEIEAALLEEAGKLEAASDVWQQLIAAAPEESSYRTQLVSVQMRMGKRQDARETLLLIRLNDIRENVKALLDVAQLRAALRMPDVLPFALRARQVAPGDAQVHGAYVRLCMEAGKEESEAAQLAPERVRIGDTVHLVRNGKTTVFVILDEEPIRADHGELRADSPRARALLGKRKGETVSLDNGILGSQEYEIAEIMSKYVHACRETMRLMEEGTLHLPSMVAGDVNDPDFLPRMFERMDRQSEHTAKIMAAYSQQPIPLSTVATLRHRSLIETWLALTAWPNGCVFTFAGTEEDAQAQASLLSSTQEVVLDLVAILSIIHLGIEDLVTSRFQKIMVAQQLLDELHQEEHDLSGQEPSATIGSVNGQRYAFEMPVGHTRPALELVQRALYFISGSAHVVGVTGLLDADQEETEFIGRATVASVLLASEQHVPLYSDDLRTRLLAQQKWQVACFDTQGILANLHTRKAIEGDPYYKLLARMSQANYHFVRFNVEAVFSILEQNMISTGSAEVRGVFRAFRGPDCTEESAVVTLAELTAKVWHKTLLEHQKTFILGLVLETLVAGRSLRVLTAFRAHLKPKFRFTEFYLGEIYQHIKVWEHRRIA